MPALWNREITSPLAARLYGLDIVAEDVADHHANETRFVVVSRQLHTGPADKGSIVLTTEDRSGALMQALGAFADHRPGEISGGMKKRVGIAGGTEKCDYLTRELGLDAAIDYKDGVITLKAEADFQKALKIAPRNPDVNNNYGWFLCNIGQPRQSIQYFLNALKDPLYDTPDVAYANAGACAMKAGDLDGAARRQRAGPSRALHRAQDRGARIEVERVAELDHRDEAVAARAVVFLLPTWDARAE